MTPIRSWNASVMYCGLFMPGIDLIGVIGISSTNGFTDTNTDSGFTNGFQLRYFTTSSHVNTSDVSARPYSLTPTHTHPYPSYHTLTPTLTPTLTLGPIARFRPRHHFS